MRRIIIALSMIFPISIYATDFPDNNIYYHYLDKCMDYDPSDYEYCTCIGKCMATETDETDRKYFERDWFFGQCRVECDRWYNSIHNPNY